MSIQERHFRGIEPELYVPPSEYGDMTVCDAVNCPRRPKARRHINLSAILCAGLALLGFAVLLVCSAGAEHQKRCEMPFHTGLICGDE